MEASGFRHEGPKVLLCRAYLAILTQQRVLDQKALSFNTLADGVTGAQVWSVKPQSNTILGLF